jgi:L-2-hydroxyglutarate oxidase LhgO
LSIGRIFEVLVEAAKVYGQAEVGAPPMSVPHIDTRIIDGKRVVLFGSRHTLWPAECRFPAAGSALRRRRQ